MTSNNRRNIEDILEISNFPNEFSAHQIKSQCKKPFSVKFFDCQNDMLKILAKKIGFDISMISIKPADGVEFSKSQAEIINNTLYDVMESQLRSTDQVFDKTASDCEFTIVLPATSMSDTQLVIDKIKQSIMQKAPELFDTVRYSFSAESLYTPEAA